jgi:GntR family transcriptional repressor for pyruvate dehydrogenase complex
MSRPVEAADAGRSQSSSEAIAERIRCVMLTESLRPGDRLGREEDLARDFGVSRPTLREALRLLSSDHLIRASKGPGGGIFVAATPEEGISLSVSATVASMLDAQSIELDELLETRMLLEVPIAGLAAQRASAEDVGELEALAAELTVASDVATIEELDARVHRHIARIANNRLAGVFASWIVDVFQPRLRAVIAPAVVEAVIVDQQLELLRAVVRADRIGAERSMAEHLTYLRDLVSVVSRPEN